MIKNFLVSLGLLFSVVAVAQNGSSSIYSFYGIGDVTFKGALENRSMGGVSVFADSVNINFQNPAALTGLKLTSFTIGATNRLTNFKTNTDEGKGNRSGLDYLALAIPLSSKFGASFGLMPYSSVGYRIQSLAAAGSTTEGSSRYTGSGGLSRAFLAMGYEITSKFSVGVDLNYNFGEIATNSTVFAPGNLQYGSREKNVSEMSGLSLNAGLMYQTKIDKFDVFGSFVYTPSMDMKLKNDRYIGTIVYSGDVESIVDEREIDVNDIKMKMPSKISFGGGFGVVRKWLIGTEITLQDFKGYGNRFDEPVNGSFDNGSFENGFRIGVGGYFIPKYNSFTSYLERIVYRGGLRYEKTGLVVQNPVTLENKSITDMAFTLGLGFPLRGSFSNVNVGFEMGRRGTKAADLVQENYKNISISLSLNDQWFVKRKYD